MACPQPPSADAPLKVAIDIGHSRKRGGATSARGVKEYDFNARFAHELHERATSEKRLALVIVNPDGASLRLRERPGRAEQLGADVFVSIHHDSAQLKYFKPWIHNGERRMHAEGIRGFSLFISKANAVFPASARLARVIGEALVAAGKTPTLHHAEPIPGENRTLLHPRYGIYEAPFTVVKTARMPAVLIEAGVIANKEDEALLETAAYRRKLQDAILAGLLRFCGPGGSAGQLLRR